MNWDSGQMRGKRMIRGGRFEVRRALYMPAVVVATRNNAPLIAFYSNMIKRGKALKVAIIAVMRKLITIANTLVKNNTLWNYQYA